MEAITPQEVNAYLPTDKWAVDVTTYEEPELESNARAQVLGRLRSIYPVDDWTATGGVAPALVRQVIAMYIAAWIYARQFSEDTANINSYASWLLRQAESIVTSLLNGDIALDDIERDVSSDGEAVSGPPIFTTGRVF